MQQQWTNDMTSERDDRGVIFVIGGAIYQRRPPYVAVCCCIMAGDIEDGGLGTRMPVFGFTMGMALRVRRAAGWWILF